MKSLLSEAERALGRQKLKDVFQEINRWEVAQIEAELGDDPVETTPGFHEKTLRDCLAILDAKKAPADEPQEP